MYLEHLKDAKTYEVNAILDGFIQIGNEPDHEKRRVILNGIRQHIERYNDLNAHSDIYDADILTAIENMTTVLDFIGSNPIPYSKYPLTLCRHISRIYAYVLKRFALVGPDTSGNKIIRPCHLVDPRNYKILEYLYAILYDALSQYSVSTLRDSDLISYLELGLCRDMSGLADFDCRSENIKNDNVKDILARLEKKGGYTGFVWVMDRLIEQDAGITDCKKGW